MVEREYKSKNSSGRSCTALLSQVHTIHRSQHSIWASLVGTHQYAQFVGLDSRCAFAPAVFACLWKAELDLLLIYLPVYFTSIFEENLRMLLIGFPTHYRLLFLLSVSEWVLSELL